MVDTPKEIRKIQNVIGVIEGEIEPGKVIIKIFIFVFIFKIFTFGRCQRWYKSLTTDCKAEVSQKMFVSKWMVPMLILKWFVLKKIIVLDRLIMIGNHRDGWVYGALDPSSGTAVLMEVVRLIGQMLKDGKKFHSYYKT